MPIASSLYRHDRYCLRLSAAARPSLKSGISELNHFNLAAYGLQLLCLRLAMTVTSPNSRLDTECIGYTFHMDPSSISK